VVRGQKDESAAGMRRSGDGGNRGIGRMVWLVLTDSSHGSGPGIENQSVHFDCLSLCPRQFIFALENMTLGKAASGWRLIKVRL
jgi:hypothetical protein